ncbi:hypothetical protein, partial [Vibrio parahaemolyticus]|uniref:hypothetical protein n=1 Tax=Vibrio parahaemolyticus TaxID=670 RepID=UPI00301D2D78
EPTDFILLFNNENETECDVAGGGTESGTGYYPGLPDDIPAGLTKESAMYAAVTAERFANQCDLMEIMSYKEARQEYLNSPDY